MKIPEVCPRGHRWDAYTGQGATPGPGLKAMRGLGVLRGGDPGRFRVLLEIEDEPEA